MSADPEPRRRIYTDSVSDSSRWDAFVPRAGDIVVCTPPKFGTFWTQGILAMLIAGDAEVDAQTSMKSLWIDITIRDLGEVMARLEAQGKSIKAIVRELRVLRRTVRKVIRSEETDFSHERTSQPEPKIGPWRDQLDRLLAANAARASRERLTLIRIFEEMRGLGYPRTAT